ncbi:MAG: endonuclease III [Ignisphaera sp.]
MKDQGSLCTWNKDKVLKLFSILAQMYSIDINEFAISIANHAKTNFFEILVAIILSQNTNDKNAVNAFNNLKTAMGVITPQKIINIDDEELKVLIRVAGLINRKTKALKELATIIIEKPEFFDKLMHLDVEEARKKMLELPGVGHKTADVFLLMVLRKPTFPIDTHINRVVRRLGIASLKDTYEVIRARILDYLGYDVEKLIEFHLLLIMHGRKTCKARNPLCTQCLVFNICCRVLE